MEANAGPSSKSSSPQAENLLLKKVSLDNLAKTKPQIIARNAEFILGELFQAAIKERQSLLAREQNSPNGVSPLTIKDYGKFITDIISKDGGVAALIPPRYNLERKISRQFMDTIVKMAAGFEVGKPGFIAQAPTGTGKSFLIGMLSSTMPKGSPVLISVPNKDLLEQTAAYISRFNPDKKISYISSNQFSKAEQSRLGQNIERSLNGDIVLAVNDSLSRLAEANLAGISEAAIKSFKPSLCIVDEVHKINSKSPVNQKIHKLLTEYINAGAGFVGVSATPDNLKVFNEATLDSQESLTAKRVGNTALFTRTPIEDLFKDQGLQLERVFEKSLAESIKDKELSPIKWHAMKMSDVKLFQGVKESDLDEDGDIKDARFNKFLDAKVGQGEKTNWDFITEAIAKKISTDEILKDLRAVSFTPNIEKSKSLAKMLDDYGIKSASYTGKGIFISNDLIQQAKNYRKDKYGEEFLDGFKGKITEDTKYKGFSVIADSDAYAAYNKRLLFSMLENRDLKNVSSVEKLHTGIDFPWLDLAILTPTASHSKYMQMLGRVTRLDPQNPHKEAHVLEVLLDGNAVFQPFNIASATGMSLGNGASANPFLLSSSQKLLNTESAAVENSVDIKSLDQYSGFMSLTSVLAPLLKTELDGGFKIALKIALTERARELIDLKVNELSDTSRADLIPKSELLIRSSGVEKYNPLIWLAVQEQLKTELDGIRDSVSDSVSQVKVSSTKAPSALIQSSEAKKHLLINLASLRFPLHPVKKNSLKEASSPLSYIADIEGDLKKITEKNHIERRYVLAHLRNYQKQYGFGIHRRIDSDAKDYLRDQSNERFIVEAAKELRDNESHLYPLRDPYDMALLNTYSISKYAQDKSPGRSSNRFTENIISEDGLQTDKGIDKELWTEIKALKSAENDSPLSSISALSDHNYINLRDVYKGISEKLGFDFSSLDSKPKLSFESNAEAFLKRLLKKDNLNILDDQGKAAAYLSLGHNQIENLSINDNGTFTLNPVRGLSKDDFQKVLDSLDKILKQEAKYLYPNKAFPRKEGGYFIPSEEQINAYGKWIDLNRDNILARTGLDRESFEEKVFRNITDHSLTKTPAIAMKISFRAADGEKKLFNLYSEFIKAQQATSIKMNGDVTSDNSSKIIQVTRDNFRTFFPPGRTIMFNDLFTRCEDCYKFLKKQELSDDEIAKQHLQYSHSQGLIVIKSDLAKQRIIK